MSVKQLDTLLADLAESKKEITGLEALLKPARERQEASKLKLMTLMQKQQMARTAPLNGVYAIRAKRDVPVITDDNAVKNFIQEHGFDLEEYLELIPARVKAMAEGVLHETGEIPDGFEMQTTEFLQIRNELK